jgi:hypothetical protein
MPPAPWMIIAVRALKPVVRRVGCRAIVGRNRSRSDPTAGRFTRTQVNRTVNRGFARLDQRISELPSEPTLGSRQNVLLAALTLSFMEALEADSVEHCYAIELTGDVCWRFYRQWGQGTRVATRLITRDPVKRLRLSVNAFLTFPFGQPGYRFDDVPQPDGRSLDMHRCPVADYLKSQGAADLCAGSWCNLDYALAEMWGGTLGRSTTLVTGGSCCDFRFRTATQPEAPLTATAGQPPPMAAT